MQTEYRIRYKDIRLPPSFFRERVCFAERKVNVFGIFTIWYKISEYYQGPTEPIEAIGRHKCLSNPLPIPKLVE